MVINNTYGHAHNTFRNNNLYARYKKKNTLFILQMNF